MSLLDLLFLKVPQAGTVIAAVRQWCAERGSDISDKDGRKAVAAAVVLAQSADGGGPDFIEALRAKMASAQPRAPTILVLEDEPFIALDMEQILQGGGFAVEVRASCLDAMAWLSSQTPSIAVLDFQLRDGDCTDVALLLQDRDIPIVFCSGADPGDIPATFRQPLWLPKPFQEGQFLDVVRQGLRIRNANVGENA
ncbi:response regulator [Pararhizobium sp. O133]|uniref:response regulator n=1 Tax=Pararhizobium sp. O133 TaxID=3449278 RepID=UPI003F686CD4